MPVHNLKRITERIQQIKLKLSLLCVIRVERARNCAKNSHQQKQYSAKLYRDSPYNVNPAPTR